MSPVSPKPCSKRTAGPEPPTRTYWEPPLTGICSARNAAGHVPIAAGAIAKFLSRVCLVVRRHRFGAEVAADAGVLDQGRIARAEIRQHRLERHVGEGAAVVEI